MRTYITLVCGAVASLILATGLRAQSDAPAWAYGIAPPAAAGTRAAAAEPAADEATLLRVPGSSRSFTLAQIEDAYGPADWFPDDHPAMPEVVAHGRKPDVRACATCHYPNGKGRPSNGSVSGLPPGYFAQQIEDFKNGLRKPADPRKNNVNQMIAFAKAMSTEEIKAAAEYFGKITWTPWVRVVETDRAPKTRIEGFIHYTLPGTETEPIGMRIVEVPEDVVQTEPLRNPRSGFIAYAPPGSLAKGEALVKTGGSGRTVQCGACHGADLNGAGNVPGIAGRSPSYLVRQMHDMQAGTRRGPGVALMKSVVEKLTNDDYVAIGAYVSSLR